MQSNNQFIGRRQCLRNILTLGAAILAGVNPMKQAYASVTTKVVIMKTGDRLTGIRAAMREFDLRSFKGASVAIKANYNSADPFPASTHPDTLDAILHELREIRTGSIVLAERSGMGKTDTVIDTMGARKICEKHMAGVVIMDDLGPDDYVRHQPPSSHWERAFLLARPFEDADKVVQTCCLKTHQYGGHFTMSLKNVVGAVAKYDPKTNYNYMSELHGSRLQRTLIAEISQAFRNDLIVMDGIKAFVTGGPHKGKEVEPGVIIVGVDPIAVDAIGVAILRMYGTTPEVSKGPIFDQEQIRRAAGLGIGVSSPDQIDIVPIGPGAQEFADKVRKELAV